MLGSQEVHASVDSGATVAAFALGVPTNAPDCEMHPQIYDKNIAPQ